jgi:hypothetical protein
MSEERSGSLQPVVLRVGNWSKEGKPGWVQAEWSPPCANGTWRN